MSNSLNPYAKGSIVSEEWEFIDPTPDICALFVQFDERFFWGALKGVVVKWSSRMTLCAGLCRYEGRSGMCSISLSEPLLKLRPRKDLVETLLHEMIHAYLFVTANNRDRDGHGPEFQSHMLRINRETGTNITIYHSFHDEVRLYKQHWWKCDGPCQHQPPFFGLVKRAMNRAPGPNDTWWAQHRMSCNGSFIKIKEPENYGVKKKKTEDESSSKAKKQKISGVPDIRNFFKSPSKSIQGTTVAPGPSSSSAGNTGQNGKGKSLKVGTVSTPSSSGSNTSKTNGPRGSGASLKNKGSSTVVVKVPGRDKPANGSQVTNPTGNPFVPFQGTGHVLGGMSSSSGRGGIPSTSAAPQRDPIPEVIDLDCVAEVKYVKCPCCLSRIKESVINAHLDSCLNGD